MPTCVCSSTIVSACLWTSAFNITRSERTARDDDRRSFLAAVNDRRADADPLCRSASGVPATGVTGLNGPSLVPQTGASELNGPCWSRPVQPLTRRRGDRSGVARAEPVRTGFSLSILPAVPPPRPLYPVC